MRRFSRRSLDSTLASRIWGGSVRRDFKSSTSEGAGPSCQVQHRIDHILFFHGFEFATVFE